MLSLLKLRIIDHKLCVCEYGLCVGGGGGVGMEEETKSKTLTLNAQKKPKTSFMGVFLYVKPKLGSDFTEDNVEKTQKGFNIHYKTQNLF